LSPRKGSLQKNREGGGDVQGGLAEKGRETSYGRETSGGTIKLRDSAAPLKKEPKGRGKKGGRGVKKKGGAGRKKRGVFQEKQV